MTLVDVFPLPPQTPSPGGPDTPEQRSFRDRQKYFEIDVKQTTPDKPKPRVSLVGADDLKKMREEEGLLAFISFSLWRCNGQERCGCWAGFDFQL